MLILASASPRRQHLLAEAGFAHTVQVRPTHEHWPPAMPAQDVAAFLATQKAQAWHPQELAGKTLIAADTTVVLGQAVLNKPASPADARAMLEALSGQTHLVITGVALRTAHQTQTLSEITEVRFRTLATTEIEAYIATGAPFDKAGGYGIQDGFGMAVITGIVGCYYNVMGLPVARLYPVLKALGY